MHVPNLVFLISSIHSYFDNTGLYPWNIEGRAVASLELNTIVAGYIFLLQISNMTAEEKKCVFCRIVDGKDDKTELLHSVSVLLQQILIFGENFAGSSMGWLW